MTYRNSLIVFFAAFFASCSSIPMQQKNPFDLKTVESLPLGSTRSEVAAALGKADDVRTPADGFDSELWMYLAKVDGWPYPKTSLFFDPKSGKLTGKSFVIDEHAPENRIETVLKRYNHATFQRVEEPRCYEFGPNKVYYIDQKYGLTITTSLARNDASGISWYLPNEREIASIQTCPENELRRGCFTNAR